MDRLEVWASERGRHVPPEGHAFAVVARFRAQVHLVDLGVGTDSNRIARCNLRILPAEIVPRARGTLCERCADVVPGSAPLRWHERGSG